MTRDEPKTQRDGTTGPRSAGDWTMDDVEGRLVEAADTLKRVRVPDIRRNLTRWPDFVRAAREAYGYQTSRVRLAPASPGAIDRLDATLAWLRWLSHPAQRILWGRANGVSWRRIAVFAGKSPNTCRAWYLAALHHITARLNGAARDVSPRRVGIG